MYVEVVIDIETDEVLKKGFPQLVNTFDLLPNTLSARIDSLFSSQRTQVEDFLSKEFFPIMFIHFWRLVLFHSFLFTMSNQQAGILLQERIMIFDKYHRSDVFRVDVTLEANDEGKQMNIGHAVRHALIDRCFNAFVGE